MKVINFFVGNYFVVVNNKTKSYKETIFHKNFHFIFKRYTKNKHLHLPLHILHWNGGNKVTQETLRELFEGLGFIFILAANVISKLFQFYLNKKTLNYDKNWELDE